MLEGSLGTEGRTPDLMALLSIVEGHGGTVLATFGFLGIVAALLGTKGGTPDGSVLALNELGIDDCDGGTVLPILTPTFGLGAILGALLGTKGGTPNGSVLPLLDMLMALVSMDEVDGGTELAILTLTPNGVHGALLGTKGGTQVGSIRALTLDALQLMLMLGIKVDEGATNLVMLLLLLMTFPDRTGFPHISLGGILANVVGVSLGIGIDAAPFDDNIVLFLSTSIGRSLGKGGVTSAMATGSWAAMGGIMALAAGAARTVGAAGAVKTADAVGEARAARVAEAAKTVGAAGEVKVAGAVGAARMVRAAGAARRARAAGAVKAAGAVGAAKTIGAVGTADADEAAGIARIMAPPMLLPVRLFVLVLPITDGDRGRLVLGLTVTCRPLRAGISLALDELGTLGRVASWTVASMGNARGLGSVSMYVDLVTVTTGGAAVGGATVAAAVGRVLGITVMAAEM